MLQLLALAQFATVIALVVTLVKVFKVKRFPRIKMLLAALYAVGLMLYLNESRGMDIADRHGLRGDEPLIFGSWQLPIEAGLVLTILALQVYFLLLSRKQKISSSKPDGKELQSTHR